MVLVNFQSYNLDYSRAMAYCTFSRCGWGCLDIFSLVYHFSLLSPSVWETARYRLRYYLKGPINPKQPIYLFTRIYIEQLCIILNRRCWPFYNLFKKQQQQQ